MGERDTEGEGGGESAGGRRRGRGRGRGRGCRRGRERDSDVVDAKLDFKPFDDATNYYGEHDCADAFDDEGLSARYFDRE